MSESLSLTKTGAFGRSTRPQEIVLLEDSDLYRYHQQQHSLRDQQSYVAQRDEQDDGHAAIHVAHEYPYESYPPQPHATPMHTSAAFANSQYERHAAPTPTPFAAPSTVRKPSFTSIDTIPMSHGALRPGGAVDLFSRQSIGLLLNWTLVGFFNGSISSLVFPFFESFLGYNDYQANAASTLLNVPWLFKFLAGFLSDCFPIKRQRRKPYIFIGWTMFMLFMVAMTFMQEPLSISVDDNAPKQGPKYVIIIMFGSLGHLLSTASVEGMMVEYAQREGEFARGQTQCWCIVFRFLGEMAGALTLSMSLNSADFGGDFAASVPLRAVFGAHAVLAALGLVITKCWLHEDSVSTSSQRLATQFRRIWSIMQKRTTWQITLFGFFAKLATNYEMPGNSGVLRKWLEADSLVLNVADALGSIGFMVAAFVFMKFLLNANWRKLFVSVIALSLLVMVPVDIVTVFNIKRALPLNLISIQVVSMLDAFVFLLRIVVIVEVAEPGYEAVTYGILTTVFNLGSTVMSMCKNVVASQWPKSITDMDLDTHAVRWHYMRSYLFKYGFRVATVVLIVHLLPRQKRHLKELNLRGAPNLVIPIVLFLIFASLFLASITSNMLALFEPTACLIFAGGKGCKN